MSWQQAVGKSTHTWDRKWQADRHRVAEQRAGAMRPLQGDPRLLELTGTRGHPSSISSISRQFARYVLAPKLGPCSDRAKSLRKEGSGVQFWPFSSFTE